jgi:intracellular sulfur oxidation DsrE/DsrF family protein
MKLDIVTNQTGINILRPGVSPYLERIQKMVENGNVRLYACKQSIAKAYDFEGIEIVFMPGVVVDKIAADIISPRMEAGWVYIKA